MNELNDYDDFDYEDYDDCDDCDLPEDRTPAYHDHLGRGYVGHSMSVNAKLAREDGERPISEWTKKAFREAISSISPEKAKLIAKINPSVLHIYFLERTASHHTSSWYNPTQFYALNVDAVKNISTDTLIELAKLKPPKAAPVTVRGTFKFIEWQKRSSRWNPWGVSRSFRAIPHELSDVAITVKGQFFIVQGKDGKAIRKKIGSNGTEAIIDSCTQYPANVCAFLGVRPPIERCTPDPDTFDVSRRGQIYPKGRKPSPDAFDKGLGNFFKVGEKRVGKNVFGCYQLEEWNGGWWLPVRE